MTGHPSKGSRRGSTDVRRLPDFVGIGALKAGTSYLDAMLRSHPDVAMPTHLKEVDYFTTHLDRGPAWYRDQFPPPDERPHGEISPKYLFDPRCPSRIAAANPGARLLLVVRDPVARTFSQYRHWVQETGYRGSFEQFLRDHPSAADRSLYWALLQRYRAEFPDEQIHVSVFEELVARPADVLPGVYAHIGVDPTHVPAAAATPVNASGVPRHPRLYARGKRMSDWLYRHGAGRTVERVKSTGVAAALRGRGNATAATAPAASTAAMLARRYTDDVDALSDHLGRDLRALWTM